MIPGATYYLLDHLWVVVSSPAHDGGIAMVNFTTYRPPCDESCVVDVGDHPFIRHKSIVPYFRAQMSPPAAHAKVKQQPPGAPVSAALLYRIQYGALVSLATPPKVRAAVANTLPRK